MTAMMAAAMMMAAALPGCKSARCPQAVTVHDRSDSARTEIVRHTKTLIPDTLSWEIPPQRAQRTTFDTVSFLENDFSTSTARVNADGSLFHDLHAKAGKRIDIPTQKEVERRDSIVYVDCIRETKVEVPVRQPLTRWQKAQIWGFWGLLLAFTALGLYFIRRKARTLIRGNI